MAGTSPRLSGSCYGPVEGHLPRVDGRAGFLLLESCEIPALHQVRSYESSGFEQSLIDVRHLAEPFDQQVGDQGDRDLNTHRVVGAADEMPNLGCLLHDAEVQLDLPASLIKFGDLFGGRVQVVGQNPQLSASIHRHDDFANGALHWVLSTFRLTRRQESDPVAHNIRSGFDRQGFYHPQWGVFQGALAARNQYIYVQPPSAALSRRRR